MIGYMLTGIALGATIVAGLWWWHLGLRDRALRDFARTRSVVRINGAWFYIVPQTEYAALEVLRLAVARAERKVGRGPDWERDQSGRYDMDQRGGGRGPGA